MEYFGLILVFSVFQFNQCEGKSNWQIVPEPATSIDIEKMEPQLTYNDEKTRMTAIHDLKYNACFLTNYDPEWSLGDEDKKKLTKSLVAQTIETDEDMLKFRIKVGLVIASICKKHNLYWLTRPEIPPKPQMPDPVAPPKPLGGTHGTGRPMIPPKPKAPSTGPEHEMPPPTMNHGQNSHQPRPFLNRAYLPVETLAPVPEKYIIPRKQLVPVPDEYIIPSKRPHKVK